MFSTRANQNYFLGGGEQEGKAPPGLPSGFRSAKLLPCLEEPIKQVDKVEDPSLDGVKWVRVIILAELPKARDKQSKEQKAVLLCLWQAGCPVLSSKN